MGGIGRVRGERVEREMDRCARGEGDIYGRERGEEERGRERGTEGESLLK